MTNEERKNFYMNRNIKLSPTIIAITWDVIFVWVITTLYLTSVKGFSNSQAVMLDSILMFAGCIMCVPVNKLLQNIKPINGTRIGLCGYAGWAILYIVGEGYLTFVCAQIFLAFGYAVLSVKSNMILTRSLSAVKRDKDYQRVYGKGLSKYYLLDFLGSIFVVYVYNWMPIAVFIISLLTVVFCFVLTFFLKEPEKFIEKNVNINSDEKLNENSEKPESFGKILKSTFLITLLVYAFFFRGVLSISGTSLKIYLNTVLNDGTIPLWSYGFLFAISRLCASLSSKYQFKFNLKFGLKSLLIFNVLLILTFVITGSVFLLNINEYVKLIIILIACYIMGCLRMPNQIFLNNYLQVCTPKRNVERVYSIRIMAEYMGYALISFVYSILLSVFEDNYGLTNVTYIAIFGIPLVVALLFFIRALCKKYAQKYTIIKSEYVED